MLAANPGPNKEGRPFMTESRMPATLCSNDKTRRAVVMIGHSVQPAS